MIFNFVLKFRDGSNVERESQGTDFQNALSNLLNTCIEEDDTGIFFELENANLEELEKDINFYKVNDYGVIVVSYTTK